MFKWLVFENIPYNTIQAKTFKQMFTGITPSFQPMNRDTFLNYLDRKYDILKTQVIYMVKKRKENCFKLPFISVCHNMWTTVLQDNVPGSCIRFITSKFDMVQIACFFGEKQYFA
jgi:hypothetical protein